MKHLQKYNEGLFTTKIPKEFIDKVVSNIRSRYADITVIRPDPTDRYYDRVIISIGVTGLGKVNLVYTILKSDNKRIKFLPNKIIDAVTKPQIDTTLYISKKSVGDIQTSYNNMMNLESNYIDYIEARVTSNINRALTLNKHKKSTEDFYEKVSMDDIKELLYDIIDLYPSYKLTRKDLGKRKGFFATFDITTTDKSKIFFSKKGEQMNIKPNDYFTNLMNMINDIYSKSMGIYKMHVSFELKTIGTSNNKSIDITFMSELIL